MFELISITSKFSQTYECWSVRTEESTSWGCMSMLSRNNALSVVPHSTSRHQDLLALKSPGFPALEAFFYTQAATLALASTGSVYELKRLRQGINL